MVKIASKYIAPGIHLLIWASVLVIPLFIFHNFPIKTGLPDYYFLFTNIYHIGLFYLNAWFLYPRLFNRKTWWLYFAIIGTILALSYFVKLFIITWVFPGFILNAFNNRILFFPPLPFLLASFILRFITDRVRDEKLERERKAEQLESELKFLRSQISPHFLFNMMTNMVSLARQKSELLEPSLIQLSDLLRYMLYESDKDKFLLSQEIIYLKSYVELQQLRFGEGLDLSMEIKKEEPDCYIEPMLLVPFVENAFKHGIGMVPNPYIRIKLAMQHGKLQFSISNNYNSSNSSKDNGSGIGLLNVKNRLNLLYPRKYDLSIQDDGSVYKVNLNLEMLC
ncbi:MAG TPA: histidine kinase [Puia sp.]|jgi:two-component system LytT family sensor kinase|nr:histidine kinase [Puia sp.]